MNSVKLVSVHDHLPDDDREVLAVSNGRVLIENYWGVWFHYVEDEDGCMIPKDIEVDYWMELPEPPESDDHVL